MTPHTNIALVGFMGTGKSTVGRLLARELNWSFVDVDDAIVETAGCSIPDIFSQHGESGFRELERTALLAILQGANQIISCGGGIVTVPDNIDSLQKQCTTLCLTASPDALYARVKGDSNRPLLQVENPLVEIRGLIDKRAPLYDQFTEQIDTGDKSPQDLVAEIRDRLGI